MAEPLFSFSYAAILTAKRAILADAKSPSAALPRPNLSDHAVRQTIKNHTVYSRKGSTESPTLNARLSRRRTFATDTFWALSPAGSEYLFNLACRDDDNKASFSTGL
jgi:hypothetical protein